MAWRASGRGRPSLRHSRGRTGALFSEILPRLLPFRSLRGSTNARSPLPDGPAAPPRTGLDARQAEACAARRGPLSRLRPAPGARRPPDPTTACCFPRGRGEGGRPAPPGSGNQSSGMWFAGLLGAGRPLAHPGGRPGRAGKLGAAPAGNRVGPVPGELPAEFSHLPPGELLWGETADRGRVTNVAGVAKRARTPVLDRSNKQKPTQTKTEKDRILVLQISSSRNFDWC